MKKNLFLEIYESINKDLVNEPVIHSFRSIGSNIFFDFGKPNEIKLLSGKKTADYSWTIWISNASWRISRKEKYVAGSGDSPEEIDASIEKIVGKKFQSMKVRSQFLDVSFCFEDDYEVRVFFNWCEDTQWVIFTPANNIKLECVNSRKRKQAQEISQFFVFSETCHPISLPEMNFPLCKIQYDKRKMPFLHFENDLVLYLKSCAWRLEKEGDFITGCLDDTEKEQTTKLKQLLGKKLKQIDILDPFIDARIEFEEGYVLKTFCCVGTKTQWTLSLQDEVIFEANISLEQSLKPPKKKSATLAKADS